MFLYDPTYILLVPALIFAFFAQARVQSTFRRFLEERSQAGMTGAQVARRLLDAQGLHDVPVESVGGHLSDHYDPRTRTVRLSPQVYRSTSIAAVGVAAHETGHAVQHAQNYIPLGIRSNLFPVANFGSHMAFPLFFIGLLMSSNVLMNVGIWLFTAALAFQLVTLPVELNASRRAMGMLQQGGYVTSTEAPKAKQVLNAAALTYVAAVAMAAAQLMRLLVLRGSRRD